jgi:sulfatase modifying factor 1
VAPLKPTGFWSYTSADDAASDGRLSRLRQQLANRLKQQLGRPVHLFQDVAAIPPGTSWEQQIHAALTEASFFVPILTPGFLQSEWCAKEVRRFRTLMESLGRDDLILPVHYLDVTGFANVRRGDCIDIEVFDYLRSLQWVDFRTLEPLDSDTTEVRVWLAGFARRVEEALYRETPPLTEETTSRSVPAEDTLPPTLSPPAEAVAPPPPPVQPKLAHASVEETKPEPRNDPSVADTVFEPPAVAPNPVAKLDMRYVWAAVGLLALCSALFVSDWPTHDPPRPRIIAAQSDPAVVTPLKPASVGSPPPLKALRDTCLANAICPEMVLIPRGSFQMGTTDDELAREKVPEKFRAGEKPRHPVTIGADFYMGKYDVTVGEFKAFVRATGARPAAGCVTWRTSNDDWQLKPDLGWEHPGFIQTDRDPVVCVSYDDATEYVAWLNTMASTKLYRLPSEAEWEYAARAGTATARFWGDGRAEACRFANVCDKTLQKRRDFTLYDPNEFFACSDGFAFTAPVGSFQPNAFGLYDMLGNTLQWTADCWTPDYRAARSDGLINKTGDCNLRVQRGGAWINIPQEVRSGNRFTAKTDYRDNANGFRLARTL